jgi:hypothetical protein
MIGIAISALIILVLALIVLVVLIVVEERRKAAAQNDIQARTAGNAAPTSQHFQRDAANKIETSKDNRPESSNIVYTIFYVLIGGIGVFGFLGSSFFSNHSGPGNEQAAYEDEKAMAITMAQNFVKDRLKSPSSASFPWDFKEYNATKSSDGKWSLSGWVEATNAFNAKLRVPWSVVVRRDGKNWALLSINIQE